jgi:hypothetical protein
MKSGLILLAFGVIAIFAVMLTGSRGSSSPEEPGANDITDPKHLELLQRSINYGGYNCSQIYSASFTHEDSRGLNFSVGCSTGIFRVTANRAGRVTDVTCRMVC